MLEGMMFPLAASLYLVAIVGEQFQGRLKHWSVTVFAGGLFVDASATLVVCVLRAESMALTFHACMGWVALAIMGVHYLWARSVWTSERATVLFHRWSPWAAGIWSLAFVSGIPGFWE